MKLLYLVFQWSKSSMQGVLKKISDQSKALVTKIGEVQTWIIGAHSRNLERFQHLEYIDIHKPRGPYLYQLFIVRQKSYKVAQEKIKYFQPDVIYLRYPLSDPGFIRFLYNVLKTGAIIITEHQAKEIPELISLHKNLMAFSEYIFGSRALKLVNGLVGVTKEIIQYELNRLKDQKPYIVIPNGIDVDTVSPRSIPENFNMRELHFLILAAKSNSWHGIDRIIKGFENYKGKIPINLHIAGNLTKDIERIIETVSKEKRDKIHLHGFLSGEKLNSLFTYVHAGFSSLAIHRKKLKELAALKSREYCARGLPFVYAGEDPDFPEDFPYTKKIPLDDSPVDFQEIIDFTFNVYKDDPREVIKKMRNHAFKHLDWKVKMEKLVNFAQQLFERNQK